MATLTFTEAQNLFAPFITSQGPTDPVVASAINFATERFITSGQWRGNRFIKSFTVNQDTDGNNYVDTVPGVESILRVIAIDPDGEGGEIGQVVSDWIPFSENGLGYLAPDYGGDLQLIRLGNVGGTSDTQRYRVIGNVPETRTLYCLVRRAYVFLGSGSDLVIPSNINALRNAMQALNFENIGEPQRAAAYWELAFTSLNQGVEAFEDGEINQVDIQSKGFALSAVQNLI